MKTEKKLSAAACVMAAILMPCAVCAAPQPSTKPEVRSEASLNSIPVNGEPVVITEKEREKGKENVKNVIAELQALFAKDNYTADIKGPFAFVTVTFVHHTEGNLIIYRNSIIFVSFLATVKI